MDCSGGETAEEWCADFAAWAWQKAGIQLICSPAPGEINGPAVSFYDWALTTPSGAHQRPDAWPG